MTTNGFAVSMRGALGKRLVLESSEPTANGSAPVWTAEGAIVARTNADVVLIAPADRPSKIFRMSVSDVDTDSDGLNDWEEYQLGLNPLSATSNGQLDNRGRPITDLAHVTSRLASQSLASLMANPNLGFR
jgi:hypothetical protein